MAHNKFLDQLLLHVKLFLCQHFKTLVRQLVGTAMLLTVCGFSWVGWFSSAKNTDV